MRFKSIILVINKGAGISASESIEKAFFNFTEEKGIKHQVYVLKNNPLTELQELITKTNPDVIIAAGGDGTINMVAQTIQKTPISLIIFPFGSANGMAKEFNIGNNFNDCLSLLETGKLQKIDLLKINNDYSLHLADVGLNARIVKRFQLDNKRGKFTYAKYLFNELFFIKKKSFTLTCDGIMTKVKAVSLTFANATKYGTGAVINPEGILNDGEFEICIVKPFPKTKLLSIAIKMFTNKLKYSEYFQTIHCKQATVNCTKKTLLQIDGEVIGKLREIKLSCIPNAVNIIIPNSNYPTLIG